MVFGINKAKPIDVAEATQHLEEISPGLILQGEVIHMAFKSIRDQFYFTSHRMLQLDVQGLTGKKIEFKSVAYHAFKAFSIETAGSLDSDVELKIYADGVMDMDVDFHKDHVNIFDIQAYLGAHMFPEAHTTDSYQHAPISSVQSSSFDSFFQFLTSDHARMDNAAVHQNLQALGALLPHEVVEVAYRCGRDMVVFTSKRIILVDVQGLSGKRIEFLSLRYSCIKAYEVATPGGFLDYDAEFYLFTNISVEKRRIERDVRKGKGDIMEVQWYLNNHLLGMDAMPVSQYIPMATGGGGGASTLFSWLGNDMTQIDARELNERFHHSPPILQSNEVCELAFKGRRDLVLFTTKRILFVDVRGFTGKKVSYTSVPYTSIKIFEARTAGSMLDKDCEFGIFTEIYFEPPPPPDQDGNQPPPEPGMSFIEFDVNKNTTDILALHRYVSAKILPLQHLDQCSWQAHAACGHESVASPPGAFGKLADFFGQNFNAVDVQAMEHTLGAGGRIPVLHIDERVLLAFACGRDAILFTSLRILDVDTQGFTGKRVEYRTIPYTSIRSFAVESAGSFDRDAELTLAFRTPWLSCLKRDFRKAQSADIIGIHGLIAAKVLGGPGKVSDFHDSNKVFKSKDGTLKGLLQYIKGAACVDPKELEHWLKVEIPLLQSDETVEQAYKQGRDFYLITSKRVLLVDVQGLTGKKIEFISYPHKYINAFSVRSAGTLSMSQEVKFAFSASLTSVVEHKVDKSTNLFELNNTLGTKVMTHITHQL